MSETTETMNETEFKILEIFQKEPNREHSTSEIVSKVEPEIFSQKEHFSEDYNVEKQQVKEFKLKKAQLHRKILYYLGKMVQNKILRETRKTGKGEKFYEILIQAGEELVIDKYSKRSIVIQKPTTPSIPIEGYEQDDIVKRLETATWLERLNSMIIECDMIETIRELESIVTNAFSIINDVITFDSFETFLEDYSSEQLSIFLNRMDMKCSDYGKQLCILIDIAGIKNTDSFVELLKYYNSMNTKNIRFVFEVEPKEIQMKSILFSELINIFSKGNQQLYFKNKLIHKAPYFMGKAGAYTIDNYEWELYEKELKGKVIALIVSQATVMVDIEKFFIKNGKSVSKFRNLISNIAYSFLETNSVQRTQSSKFFDNIERFDAFTNKNIFRFSKNYVRFWNYGWKNKDIDPEIMLGMLKSSKEMIDTFCNYEDTIYKSCGMPTRFRVAFSFLFEETAAPLFTKPKYDRLYIKGIQDLYDDKIKNVINDKEKIFEIFDGGDLITFYRKGDISSQDVMRELIFILNSFRLPFIRYDFKSAKDMHKSLTGFINSEE